MGVYTDFRQWEKDGTWKAIRDTLHQKFPKQDGRDSEPGTAILESQSVKTTEKGLGLSVADPDQRSRILGAKHRHRRGPKVTMPTNGSKGANNIRWLTQWV